jgi:hypothetical protein
VVKIGKILNVDALILGEVTVYSPDEKSIVMVDIQSVTREPVLEHRPVEVVRDGKKSIEDIDVVTDYRVTRETRQQPQEYRVQAQAGAVIKMVDAQTGEIAWVGTATEEGINLHTASELVCERIVDSLQKALPNLNRSK